MDPEMERSTQEAIDVYFSHHHTVTSPDDSQPSLSRLNPMTSSQSVPNMPMDMGSPLLPSRNNTSESKLAGMILALLSHTTMLIWVSLTLSVISASTAKLLSNFNGKAPKVKTATTQWTQTNLSLPPVLPDDVTRVLQGYMNFNNVQQDEQPKVVVEMQDLETSCSSNSANSSVAPAGISSGNQYVGD